MSKVHNKKRNSLLIYEFLLKTMSRALVEGDTKKSSQCLKIIKRHFKPGTELYKELRLSNSIVKTTVSSEHVAASILSEAKNAARSHDVKKLDREKSLLIHTINHTFADDTFYDQHVNEYKLLATIQTLMNEWRQDVCIDLQKRAEYEQQILNWLLTEKVDTQSELVVNESPGTARLLMKVMTKKLNEKYSGVLCDDQRALLKAYAFSTANDDLTTIKTKLAEVRESLLSSVGSFVLSESNEHVLNKLRDVQNQLLAETFEQINDDLITRFMLYVKLNSELRSDD